MNIWLINPFSDLPNEGASEGRFCCLARMLVEQGHTVIWWTVDFHHRTKSRRSLEQGAGVRGQRSGASNQESRGKPRTGEPETGKLELKLLPVPEYRKNISLARLRSHQAYGHKFAEAAAKRIAEDPSAIPDVIHLSTPPLDCIEPAFALREQHGCRVTVDIMDLWPETFYRTLPKGLSFLGKLLFAPLHRKAHLAYREADGVSAVSQEYLDLVAQIRSNRLSSELNSPSAISSSPSGLHLCYVGGELIKPSLRPLPSALRFIYVGAMSPTYDLWTILDAVERLQAKGYEFEVCFAGGGVSEAGLQAEVARRDLSDTVKFLGFLDQAELREALSRSHVGLNAIRQGTFITMPHKLSDYLCAGLAVINSTIGEPAELLAASDAGSTYIPGDPESLAAVMQGYLRETDYLEGQRSNARKLAEARFNRAKTYPEMIDWILGHL